MNVGSKARNTGDREASFTAEVKLAGINPHVDVPDRVVRTLGGGRRSAALMKVAGTDTRKEDTSRLDGSRWLEDEDTSG